MYRSRPFRTAARLVNVGKALLLGAFLIAASSAAIANPKYAGIVVDAKTGKTLYSANADAYRYPASLTKIMTLYVLFEELEAGRYSLDSRLKVSKYAAARPPTKLGLKSGGTIRVKDAILGLITKSANDASTVIAENISGSEKEFAVRMTQTARQLGMSKTTFRNPHGLPNSQQRTTARDMATLGRAIQERFPQYYGYFKTRSFKYKGRTYGNHNRLLGRVKGVDGIKTGYTRASGFNLTSSVKRNGRHIVAVVMGGQTGARRNAHMTDLIRRYLPKASKGPRTAPLIASRPQIRRFEAAKLKNPPLPNFKPVLTAAAPQQVPVAVASAPAPIAPVELAPAPSVTPVPGFGANVPLPPKGIKRRLDSTFAVASALPPVPRDNPGEQLTTQSTFKTALLRAARKAVGNDPIEPQSGAVATATLQPMPVKTVSVETVPVDTLETKTVSVETIPVTAIESANTPAAPTPSRETSVLASDSGDDSEELVTVATSDRQDIEPGWQIQIAAAETETQAITMLKQAKAKTGSALRSKVPYTEPVESGGKTLYRARFVGFDTKSAAWKACRSLKKAKYACFAIYQ